MLEAIKAISVFITLFSIIGFGTLAALFWAIGEVPSILPGGLNISDQS